MDFSLGVSILGGQFWVPHGAVEAVGGDGAMDAGIDRGFVHHRHHGGLVGGGRHGGSEAGRVVLWYLGELLVLWVLLLVVVLLLVLLLLWCLVGGHGRWGRQVGIITNDIWVVHRGQGSRGWLRFCAQLQRQEVLPDNV
jgi:hypothetical protein